MSKIDLIYDTWYMYVYIHIFSSLHRIFIPCSMHMDIPGYFWNIWCVYRYIVGVSYVAAKIDAEKKLMAVDRSISKADQLRPQHPWITTCWKLGVGKYTLGASQNYKSSSQNLLERLDFLWVFLAGPESREQRDGNNWLETRRQQTVNSGILVRSPTSKSWGPAAGYPGSRWVSVRRLFGIVQVCM